jgi:hypothetical protein
MSPSLRPLAEAVGVKSSACLRPRHEGRGQRCLPTRPRTLTSAGAMALEDGNGCCEAGCSHMWGELSPCPHGLCPRSAPFILYCFSAAQVKRFWNFPDCQVAPLALP